MLFSTKDQHDDENADRHVLPDPAKELLHNAFDEHATDIHIDSTGEEFLVRFRVDGVIYEHQLLTEDQAKQLMNEIKVAAGLDIDRRFGPQEGRLEFWHNNAQRNIRVTLVPVGLNESMHLRMISEPVGKWDFDSIGLCQDDKKKVTKALKSPSGLVLIAGQTGTGKTTTLYTLSSTLDLRASVGVSIEDPVEFSLPYLRQLQVNHEHDLTMAAGLKSLLRTDPDIIIVAEIRDQESAIAAAKAALAGRLVLATVHAQNVGDAIQVMHYLSIPDYVLANILHMIIGQKLLRRLCNHCSDSRKITPDEKSVFTKAGIEAPDDIKHPVGCVECNLRGYQGLIGVFETLVIDKEDEKAIAAGFEGKEPQDYFLAKGMRSMLTDAVQKVIDGKTSLEEVFRLFWFLEDSE